MGDFNNNETSTTHQPLVFDWTPASPDSQHQCDHGSLPSTKTKRRNTVSIVSVDCTLMNVISLYNIYAHQICHANSNKQADAGKLHALDYSIRSKQSLNLQTICRYTN
jgi:hypothetical protein